MNELTVDTLIRPVVLAAIGLAVIISVIDPGVVALALSIVVTLVVIVYVVSNASRKG